MIGASRDDNPEKWPQNFTVTEYHFEYLIQDPYSDDFITRDSHAYPIHFFFLSLLIFVPLLFNKVLFLINNSIIW